MNGGWDQRRGSTRAELVAAVGLVIGLCALLYTVSVGVDRGRRLETLEQELGELRHGVHPAAARTPAPSAPDRTPEAPPPATPAPDAPPPATSAPDAPPGAAPRGPDPRAVAELQRLRRELDFARAERDQLRAEAARTDARLAQVEAALARVGQAVPPPPPAAPPPLPPPESPPPPPGAPPPGWEGDPSLTPRTLTAREGGHLTLDDGSRWEVYGSSRSEVLVWRAGDEVVVQANSTGPQGYGFLLQNRTRQSQAVVRPLD
jgi:hypothetical protein